jgi:hypothetical protein
LRHLYWKAPLFGKPHPFPNVAYCRQTRMTGSVANITWAARPIAASRRSVRGKLIPERSTEHNSTQPDFSRLQHQERDQAHP